jgi:hypothetical protein
MDVGLGHVPFIAFARTLLGLDKGHDGFSVESSAPVEYVKVWSDNGVEFGAIVRPKRSKHGAHRFYNVPLVGVKNFLLGYSGRGVRKAHQYESDRGNSISELQQHRCHPSLKYVEETNADPQPGISHFRLQLAPTGFSSRSTFSELVPSFNIVETSAPR